MAKLRTYLESARSSDLSLTDSALIHVAGVARSTFYGYLKVVPNLEAEIENARVEQQRFHADTSAGRRRREAKQQIEEFRSEIERLREANRALLCEKAAFVHALRLNCRIPAEVIQRAESIALTEAQRTLSGAGRRRAAPPYSWVGGMR